MKRVAVISLLLLPLLWACGWEQVDTGYRGVKTVWGEVDEKVGSMPEGLYFYNPISSSIREIDVRTQKKEMKVNTYTKDVQQAWITLVVNYNLQPTKAHIMYRDVGKRWDDIIVTQAIEGELKKIIGKYDAVDLIEHRGKATTEARTSIESNLLARGVILTSLELVNIQYLKEFEKAVEDKVVATQKAVEESNRTRQIAEQAKQTILAAEAQAKAIQIQAQALQANAKLVEWEAVKKWDGKLPQYMFGAGTTPFINLQK